MRNGSAGPRLGGMEVEAPFFGPTTGACQHALRMPADQAEVLRRRHDGMRGRSFGVSEMIPRDDPPDRRRIHRILICALSGPVALLWFGTIVLPLIAFGEAKTALGLVGDRKMIGTSHRHGCRLSIESGRTEWVRTLDVMAYCAPDFAPGNTVTFVYKTNVFGKLVLDNDWAVRPVSTQKPSALSDTEGFANVPFVPAPPDGTLIGSFR